MGKTLRILGFQAKVPDEEEPPATETDYELDDPNEEEEPVSAPVQPVMVTVGYFYVKVRAFSSSGFRTDTKEFRDPVIESDEHGVLVINNDPERRTLGRHRFGPGYWLEAWWEERTEEG